MKRFSHFCTTLRLVYDVKFPWTLRRNRIASSLQRFSKSINGNYDCRLLRNLIRDITHFFSLYSDAPRESDDDVDQQQQSQQDNNLASGGSDETDSLFQAFSDDARDGIAEPIYHLISEVFELRGVFGWLRRTLVTFVQITYGRTINRFYLKYFLKLYPRFKCVFYLGNYEMLFQVYLPTKQFWVTFNPSLKLGGLMDLFYQARLHEPMRKRDVPSA